MMPKFVLLEHDHPELHWDFMLENGDALLTWRLDRLPNEAAEIVAVALADHRVAYLDYEGPVSGNRGSVTRIDRGYYQRLEFADGNIRVRLVGSRLNGTARLLNIPADGSLTNSAWRMIWQPD